MDDRRFIARRTASSAKAENPGPNARRSAIVSGDQRNEIGARRRSGATRGRPVRPVRGSGSRAPSTLKSGSSSYSWAAISCRSTCSKLLPIAGPFAVIGFPHRKNVAGTPTGRPSDNHHAAGKQADRDPAGFRIEIPPIHPMKARTSENQGGILEGETSFEQTTVPLRRIERHLDHLLFVMALIVFCKTFCHAI